MDWRWPLGVLVFATVIGAFFVRYLTEKNKSFVQNHRRRERGFQPDWDRAKPGEEKRRRGIRIQR